MIAMIVYVIVVTMLTCFEIHLAVGVSLQSSKCSAMNGTCQDDSKQCMGSYISNYCSDHGSNIRCCTKTPISWADIAYSFLVGEDGYLYEGRGWQKEGAHTMGYNDVSIGLCFIGNFTETKPNDAAMKTAKRFIKCAEDLGYISANYSVYGHRDASCTACPGKILYKEIGTWNNFHCFAGETLKQYCGGTRIEDKKINTASSQCK